MNALRRSARRTRISRRRSGFTIVSMLVAVILLAVGLCTLAGASANTVTMQTRAQNRTNAIALARGYMETVRTRDPWTVVSESPVLLNADGSTSASGTFVRTLTVTTTRENLLRIDVMVTYPRGAQPVTLTTSFFRGNGLTGASS